MPRTASGIGVVSMGSLVPETKSVDFDTVAKGESYTWRATKEFSVLGDLLASVDWGEPDFLIVDLPPGPERTLQYAEYFGERASFVLVTVPSDLARGVVGRSAAALEHAGARVLGYVENMKGYFCPDCGTIKPLFPESGGVRLRVPLLGTVPFDPELSAICDRGAELPPDRPALRAVAEVAARIHELLEGR